MEKIYHFQIVLSGCGTTPDKAWQEAVEGFTLDPGTTPDKDDYMVEED